MDLKRLLMYLTDLGETQISMFSNFCHVVKRLLYSTGIRIGEAISLTNKDVDFDKKILLLNKTKRLFKNDC